MSHSFDASIFFLCSSFSTPPARLRDKSLNEIDKFFSASRKTNMRVRKIHVKINVHVAVEPNECQKLKRDFICLILHEEFILNVEHQKKVRVKKGLAKFFISSFTWKFLNGKFDMPYNIKSHCSWR